MIDLEHGDHEKKNPDGRKQEADQGPDDHGRPLVTWDFMEVEGSLKARRFRIGHGHSRKGTSMTQYRITISLMPLSVKALSCF